MKRTYKLSFGVPVNLCKQNSINVFWKWTIGSERENFQENLSESGDSTDSGSSITETQQQQKMPDLSETKLVQRKNNSMSAVVVPVSTGSSGDEGPHEDIEDKPLDSVGAEVRYFFFLFLRLEIK